MELGTRIGWVAVFATAFGTSLLLPVAQKCADGPALTGFEVLVSGPAGLVHGQPAWFANLFFLGCLVRLLSSRPSEIYEVLMAAMMLGIALCALGWKSIPYPRAQICSFDFGFYLWLATMAGLAVVTWAKWSLTR